MLRKTFPFVVFLLIAAVDLTAQHRPPQGTGIYYDLISPVFIAGGDNTVSSASPSADFLNPATSALIQRTAIDVSYLTLTGTPDQEGLAHVGNIGLTLPSSIGVFSSSLHYISSPFDNFDFGDMGSLGFSFSKALFPHLLVGLGMTTHIGSNDEFDWGLGLDLGLMHLAGNLGFLRDFRWGASIREIGKGFAPVKGRSAYPPAFTPSLGAAFKLIESDSFYLGLAGDLAFPTFQSLKINTSMELGIGDLIVIRASFPIDLYEWSEGNRRYPAFGLTAQFRIGGSPSDVDANLGTAPMIDGHWALGAGLSLRFGEIDVTPPAIEVGEAAMYISPNADGEKDVISIPISISDERMVIGYRLTVANEIGSTVRQIRNKEERPVPSSVLERLTYVEKGITIPPELRWDGRRDDGSVVPDGKYRYFIEAWDDNGNSRKSEARIVYVDNTAPQIKLQIPERNELIFSPNGDGSKDKLRIVQSGSSEDRWLAGVFDNEGRLLKSFNWTNGVPQSFEWDGKDDEGFLVADDVYAYRIESTDRAGNRVQASIKNIVLNTRSTPVRLIIDKSDFSPNGDGISDSMLLETEAEVRIDIIEWSIEVLDSSGKRVKSYSGSDKLPPSITFDGRDERGVVLPEGFYTARLVILYSNGNNPTSQTPGFNIDLSAPTANVQLSDPVFSPNGDGNKDFVTLKQETSDEDHWYGVVTGPDGKDTAKFQWRGMADAELKWDGLDDEGYLAKDGEYTYRLFATDRAGNSGGSRAVVCTLDTEETPVILFASEKEFSPNGDGIKDKLMLIPQVKKKTGVNRYELRILSESNRAIRRFSGTGSVPAGIVWNGLPDSGTKVSDGPYLALIEVIYEKGDRSSAKSPLFLVDTTYPDAIVDVKERLFSPNGDGRKDLLEIQQSSSDEELWVANIYNSEGRTVKSSYWKGKAEPLVWDGRDESGNVVADGSYSYRLASTDRAGNTTRVDVLDIKVDTVPTPIFITVSSDGFSPGGDGYRDTIEFFLYVNVSKGIEAWQFSLQHGDARRTVKSFSGTTIPRKITWDGRGDSGVIVDGIYVGEFAVVYNNGNRPVERSHRFRLDTAPPQVAIDTEPTPFSPDNDGVDDDCIISLDVDDLSSISTWEIRIRDPKGNDFTRYSGAGKPAETIIWEGRADWGERVQGGWDYTLELTIQDELRNRTTIEHKIPVDVLLDKEGERLRIVISNFAFDGDTEDLVSPERTAGRNTGGDAAGKTQNNRQTLERLASILKQYVGYSVLIESHESNTYWPDRDRALQEESRLGPLSVKRAMTIKRELIRLGLDPDRIETVGLGGRKPLVPYEERLNRWKNQRIEIILSEGKE